MKIKIVENFKAQKGLCIIQFKKGDLIDLNLSMPQPAFLTLVKQMIADNKAIIVPQSTILA